MLIFINNASSHQVNNFLITLYLLLLITLYLVELEKSGKVIVEAISNSYHCAFSNQLDLLLTEEVFQPNENLFDTNLMVFIIDSLLALAAEWESF